MYFSLKSTCVFLTIRRLWLVNEITWNKNMYYILVLKARVLKACVYEITNTRLWMWRIHSSCFFSNPHSTEPFSGFFLTLGPDWTNFNQLKGWLIHNLMSLKEDDGEFLIQKIILLLNHIWMQMLAIDLVFN